MRLRKPCPEHNMYCSHPTFDGKAISIISAQEMANSNQRHRLGDCPGGEFLADDTLVVERVSEGTCEQPLWNLGYEAREVEPQPCGMPAKFITLEGLSCNQCLADALTVREGEG